MPHRWTHEFRAPKDQWSTAFFEHRDPTLWLADLLNQTPFDYDIETLDVGYTAKHFVVRITGSNETLTFLCVLLNQHASQSPSDRTPEEEALRLEATLAGLPVTVACPACGATDRWVLDDDVTFRVGLVLDPRKVWIQRHGGEPRIVGGGAFVCHACSYALEAGNNEKMNAQLYAALTQAAMAVLGSDAEWAVMLDNREF